MTARNVTLLAAVAVLAACGAFWFLLLSPKREEQTALDAQIATQQTRWSAAETQIAQYTAAKDQYAANYRSVTNLGKAVPADDDVRSLVVQIQSAARSAGVDFRTISVDGGRSSGTPATGSAAATQAATSTLPPGASVGPAGLWTMPFSFSFKGSFFELSSFFAELERFIRAGDQQLAVTGRLLQLDAISLSPDSTGWPEMRAQVSATSFLVPPTQGLLAGATPEGPQRFTPVSVGQDVVAQAGGTP